MLPLLGAAALAAASVTALRDAAGQRDGDPEGATVAVTIDPELGPTHLERLGTADDNRRAVLVDSAAPTLFAAVDDVSGDIAGLATAFPGRAAVDVNSVSTAATLLYWTEPVQSAGSDDTRLALVAEATRTEGFKHLTTSLRRGTPPASRLSEAVDAVTNQLTRRVAEPCGTICGEELPDGRVIVTGTTLEPFRLDNRDGSECGRLAAAQIDPTAAQRSAGIAALAGSLDVAETDGVAIRSTAVVRSTDECDTQLTARRPGAIESEMAPTERRILLSLLGESVGAATSAKSIRAAAAELSAAGATTDTQDRLLDLIAEIREAPAPRRTLAIGGPQSTATAGHSVGIALEYSAEPEDDSWTIDITLDNSGDAPALLGPRSWSLRSSEGEAAPSALDEKLDTGGTVEPNGVTSGSVTFEGRVGDQPQLIVRFTDGTTKAVDL